MRYEKAQGIGRKRAWEAADLIQHCTGIRAMAVCTVRPDSTEGQWHPVGRLSWKEIARDDRFGRGGMYDLLIVDECGTVKACGRKRYTLAEVLRLAERIPVGVAMSGIGELSKALEQRRVLARARHGASQGHRLFDKADIDVNQGGGDEHGV